MLKRSERHKSDTLSKKVVKVGQVGIKGGSPLTNDDPPLIPM